MPEWEVGSPNDLIFRSKRQVAALKNVGRPTRDDLKTLGITQEPQNEVIKALIAAAARLLRSHQIGSLDGRRDLCILNQAASGASASLSKRLTLMVQVRTSTISVSGAVAVSAAVRGSDVLILYDNTIIEKRSGGSRSWRNNNPGNIISSSFARRHGAIGDAGGFAVFPDESRGMGALISLLKTTAYQALSLDRAIARYAPSSQNNTLRYQQFVQAETGLNGSKVLNTFTSGEVSSLANAIRKFEGWRQGTVTYF